jgi:hypothetical protein
VPPSRRFAVTARLCAALLAVAPLTAGAADDDNPFRKAKVGDFATYKLTTTGVAPSEGTATRTITARDDKEVTIRTVVKANGTELPVPDEKVDLTRPYDPLIVPVLGGAAVKLEKVKEGAEKLKAGGREYDARWTTYKVSGQLNGLDVTGEVKVWLSKDVPLALVKLQTTAQVAGKKLETVHELMEVGGK